MSTKPDQPAPHPLRAPSLWIEGDIPCRKGNCNVLLIAPHGHPEDDTNTGKLARELADRLDCYAVINEKYQKWSNAGLTEPNPDNFAVDLYCWAEAMGNEKTKTEFIDVIKLFKKKILETGNPALLIHIHGIKNKNMLLVAEKLNEYKDKQDSLHAVIGYGQRKGDNSRFTASKTDLVIPLIDAFGELDFNVAFAPVDPIIVKKGKKRIKKWYCGNHSGRLNQRLNKPKKQVHSLQIEFRKKDVREFDSEIIETATILETAITPFIKTILASAVQRGSIQQIRIDRIDFENDQFKSRIGNIISNEEKFEQLVESIKRNGILNNIIVRKLNGTNDGPYQLISGFTSALIFGTPPCANQERHRLVRSCLAGKEDRNRP